MKSYTPWPERIIKQNRCLRTTECAVIVPIIEIKGEDHILFEVRSSKLSWQPGDICFPGGRIEEDDPSPLEAAIREAQEELGISREYIHILGPLDYVESPIGVTVWPFAAYLSTRDFIISKGEIDHLFTVPISWLETHRPQVAQVDIATRPAPNFPEGLSASGQIGWKQRKCYDIKLYEYESYKIWGITAHILDNFMEIRI